MAKVKINQFQSKATPETQKKDTQSFNNTYNIIETQQQTFEN
jgi:hypothetical protein